MSDKYESELNDIIEGFQMFSADNDGLINPNELKEIMDTMNMGEKNPFIYNIINQLCSFFDMNENRKIEPGDFISLLDQELNGTSSIEGLKKIFTALYNPSSNSISIQNISKIDKNIENDDKIKNIISKPEMNSKEINFEEFVDIMKINQDNQRNNWNQQIYKKNKPNLENKKNIKNINDNDLNYNNFIDQNDVKKVEINFNNKMINNNSNYNTTNNLNNSMNSTEKMENIFSSENKSFPEINEYNIDVNNFDNVNYYQKNKIKKNIKFEEEPKEEEIASKKKYRHMKRKQNKDKEEDNQINKELIENEKYEEKKQPDITYKTKGKIFYNNNDEIINNNDKNETKLNKRYHRRYREAKLNMYEKNEEANGVNIGIENNKDNNNNVISFSSYSKYRKKK